jgi:hypothetical protein
MDEVDFTILAATSVLGDLVDVCPPAAACRDAFERMSRATVQMCLGGGKRGPASTIIPSGGTFSTAPVQQAIDQDEDRIKEENNAMQRVQQYRPVYQQQQTSHPVPPHISQQHQMMPAQRPVSRASSTESYPQHSHEAARRRQTIHFDDGFRDLFTSPRPPHITPTTYPPQQPHQYVQSPSTPAAAATEGVQYQPSVYAHSHPQNIFPQPHGEMMIDPALQQRGAGGGGGGYAAAPTPSSTPGAGDWSHMDMSQLGIPDIEMWEHDSWSDEGGSGAPQGVDLFDGFFFGGQNS